MQVKPRFETYKILEQYPIIKDDTGNEMCLTLLEVKLHSDKDEIMESPYKFWTVIGKNQHQWNNKAVSYESVAFWKGKEKTLFKGIINGISIEEVDNGQHHLFVTENTEIVPLPKESLKSLKLRWQRIEEQTGLRTIFKITKPS